MVRNVVIVRSILFNILFYLNLVVLLFAALITLITPVFLDKNNGVFGDNPWPIFAFFSFMMVLQLLWVLTKMPETRGVSLEDLEKKLIH